MVLDIKMCRFDNVPWGFRLVGGSDFEIPLTVVKVTEGSIAEDAGLRVGDIIVRINDTAATPLAHEDAHKLIMSCGNVFYFGIQREEPEEATPPPTIDIERPSTPLSLLEDASPRRSGAPSPANFEDVQSQDDYIMEQIERPNSVLSERSEIKIVEEEIAAVLSGETEVLKEHNTMGIFPKPGVCMSSDVLRTLNEEAIKTKAEKDKENKKWTTFLQRPNRPIPKSKQQLEAERRAANAYKVKIVKSPARATSPAVEQKPEQTPEPEPVKEPTPPPSEPEVEEEPPADSEVPNLEETPTSAVDADAITEADTNEEEKTDKEKEATPETEEQCENENNEITSATEVNERETKTATPPEEPPKTEEELALERQLADVQKQLQALSSLPSTIQSTLDAVTKQLAELLPTFKLQQVVPTEEPREINLECIEEGKDEEAQRDDVVDDNKQLQDTNDENKTKDGDDDEVEPFDPAKQHEKQERREETRQMEEEQNLKKQKIELWNRLFNGESISRAIFRKYHGASVALQLELDRVNFMKYQKPERKIDLNRSEVYKVIHHLDRKPVRGIEVRAPVVPAEIDIRKAVQS